MNVSELVGFLITILVLLVALMRKLREDKFRRENPEEYAEKKRQEDESMKAFLRSLDLDVGEEEPVSSPPRSAPPPPPPLRQPGQQARQGSMVPQSTVTADFEFHSRLEDFQQRSKVAQRQFGSRLDKHTGRVLVSESMRDKPEQDAYGLLGETGGSRAHNFLNELPSRRALLLAHDIFGPPKGLQ